MRKEVLRIEHRMVPDSEFYPDIYLNVFEGEFLGVFFEELQECMSFLSVFKKSVLPKNCLIEIQGIRADAQNLQNLLHNHVAMIGMQSTLISNLSIAENIFLFDKNDKSVYTNTTAYKKMLRELFALFHIDIPAELPISMLSMCNLIRVEMLRAFVMKKRIIVLSVVAGCLSESESQKISELICELQQCGYTFLLVDSMGQDLFLRPNRCTTIKQRKVIFRANEAQQKKSFASGRLQSATKQNADSNHPVLSFRQVETGALKPFSFDLHPGELAYVCGEERCINDFLNLLENKQTVYRGHLVFDQSLTHQHSIFKTRNRHDICYIEEDPIYNLLVPTMTLLDNLILSVSLKTRTPFFSKNNKESVLRMLKGIIDDQYYHMLVSDVPLLEQYKTVYCRWLLYRPKILVCIHPFAGVDDLIRTEINRLLGLITAHGCSVIIAVSNLPQAPQGPAIQLYRKRHSEPTIAAFPTTE